MSVKMSANEQQVYKHKTMKVKTFYDFVCLRSPVNISEAGCSNSRNDYNEHKGIFSFTVTHLLAMIFKFKHVHDQ